MSIQKEPSGRRSVRVEVEVKGTPEQVWQAIASGPGISAWFVPTKVDGRVGGTVDCDFGSGMESSAQITTWDPPRRFVAENATWLQGGPPVATEWTVEARAGGTCIVRVVHSLFASTDEWDDQITSTEKGWPGYFRVLKLYLEHHAGKRSASMVAMAMAQVPVPAIWSELQRAFGVANPRPGQRLRVQAPGAAAMAATVECYEEVPHGCGMMLLLSEPTPGAAWVSAMECMGMRMATLQIYWYGDRADSAARDTARWQEWLTALFPSEQAVPPAT
jgi:uncharacterized protein YndB with AHSA1/START domain